MVLAAFLAPGTEGHKDIFLKTEGGRNGLKRLRAMGAADEASPAHWAWHSPPGVAQFLTGH